MPNQAGLNQWGNQPGLGADQRAACPCDWLSNPEGTCFEQNLAVTFELDPEALRKKEAVPWKGDPLPPETALLKMRLPQHLHTNASRDLHATNVTSASLFPGLDGFTRSLYHELRLMSER